MGIVQKIGNNLAVWAKSTLGLGTKRDQFFEIYGVGSSPFTLNNHHQYLKAYNECPPLAAVLLQQAQMATNGKVWVLKKDSEDEATGAYAENLRKFFKQPNPLQTWKEFEAQYKVYKKLYGYCVVFFDFPLGISNVTLVNRFSAFIMPPWMLRIEFTKKLIGSYTQLSDFIAKIELNYNGIKPLPVNQCLFIRDINVTAGSDGLFGGNLILPQSRCKSLEKPIGNIIASLKSNHVIIKRRGGIGILSNAGKDAIGTTPINPEQKKEVQDKLKRNYGLSDEQSEIIVTEASLNWQPMTFDAKQLMLHETKADATQDICDVLGHNKKLLSDPEAASYNNLSTAGKYVYQNTIIPECEHDFELFNSFFKTAENGIFIEKDFSELPALQKDKKEEATARQTQSNALQVEFLNNKVTLNEWRVMDGQEEIPHGDKFYSELVKEGWVFGGSRVVLQEANQNQTANNN